MNVESRLKEIRNAGKLHTAQNDQVSTDLDMGS